MARAHTHRQSHTRPHARAHRGHKRDRVRDAKTHARQEATREGARHPHGRRVRWRASVGSGGGWRVLLLRYGSWRLEPRARPAAHTRNHSCPHERHAGDTPTAAPAAGAALTGMRCAAGHGPAAGRVSSRLHSSSGSSSSNRRLLTATPRHGGQAILAAGRQQRSRVLRLVCAASSAAGRSFDSDEEMDFELSAELANVSHADRLKKVAEHLDLAWKITRVSY